MTQASPALTAAYDQARADGNERLDLLLDSIRRHTAGMSPTVAAVTMSLALAGVPETALRDLLQAALIRITEGKTAA